MCLFDVSAYAFDPTKIVTRLIDAPMGTGPRGGKKVREAAEVAAAETAAVKRQKVGAEVGASVAVTTGVLGSAAAAGVDPEDVERKSRQMLEKKGFAAAAVGRALAAVRPSAADTMESFNEQKRRRTAAGNDWLVAHADLWELPKEMLEEVKAARLHKRGGAGAGASAGGGSGGGEREEDGVASVKALHKDDVGTELSARARKLISKGLLPIAEKHVLRAGPTEIADASSAPHSHSATGAGAAGTGAQDRQRTGKSLRLQRLEKAERLAHDLCPHLASERECPHGDRCRRLHDVAGYLRAKQEDIPGPCPFTRGGGADAEPCPFGTRCRFLGAHIASDERNTATDEVRCTNDSTSYPPSAKPTPATPADPIAVAHPEVWARGEVTGGSASPTGGGVQLAHETNIFTDALQRDLAHNAY